MVKATLAEKIRRNFSKVRVKGAIVRVPKLKLKIKKTKPKKHEDKIPVSSIISIMIKSAVEKSKKEKKEKGSEVDKGYKILKEEKDIPSGYGAVSKGYGISPRASYVDYEKLFSYLGKFRAKSPYESFAVAEAPKAGEETAFVVIDKETMDKGAKYVRYRVHPTIDFINIASTSLVPVAGMSSAEWEQFKLWMKLDPVMYRLKTSTS